MGTTSLRRDYSFLKLPGLQLLLPLGAVLFAVSVGLSRGFDFMYMTIVAVFGILLGVRMRMFLKAWKTREYVVFFLNEHGFKGRTTPSVEHVLWNDVEELRTIEDGKRTLVGVELKAPDLFLDRLDEAAREASTKVAEQHGVPIIVNVTGLERPPQEVIELMDDYWRAAGGL